MAGTRALVGLWSLVLGVLVSCKPEGEVTSRDLRFTLGHSKGEYCIVDGELVGRVLSRSLSAIDPEHYFLQLALRCRDIRGRRLRVPEECGVTLFTEAPESRSLWQPEPMVEGSVELFSIGRSVILALDVASPPQAVVLGKPHLPQVPEVTMRLRNVRLAKTAPADLRSLMQPMIEKDAAINTWFQPHAAGSP